MSKQKREFFSTGFELDRASKLPIYRQLYGAFREAILQSRLRPGEQLPPTRELAVMLGVSRTSVLLAFDHLFSEGYIIGKTGAGTFVNSQIPDELFRAKMPEKAQAIKTTPLPLSERGQKIAALSLGKRASRRNLCAFTPGLPAIRAFPREIWAKLLAKSCRQLSVERFGYSEAAGYLPLRKAIAAYLRRARAVKCDAEQVIIVNGSQQGLDLACRMLADAGEAAWVEDPGYTGTKAAMLAAGLKVVPVPLDKKGLDIRRAEKRCANPKLIYLTPSHQFPTGITMPLARRLEILAWAKKHNAWILEDDYDSEYRYRGQPISALQGIDSGERVIYIGTFSKVMFPALRLGYMVVPLRLADAFSEAKASSDRRNSILEQVTMTEFIETGHFGRHIRRMRMLYQERQQILLTAAAEHLGDHLRFSGTEAGLHITAWLQKGRDDRAISRNAAAAGIDLPALSDYQIENTQGPGLIFGFAAFRETEILEGIKKMARVF